ncbi:hypothetical protein AB0I81_54930 [Nonomuraea sp. NPDC050404]|uniref:hypothetical protein n=1 Tax=Nonomuraea sp. NPDC050404 TaxID=3155783 RepID=UPI003403F328
MIPEGHGIGQGGRAALAALALGVTSLIIYALFSSGFGSLPRVALPTPEPVPVPAPVPPAVLDPPPVAAAGSALAVITGDLWLTYLPAGLVRSGGGIIRGWPGVAGAMARFTSADGFAEAQVEHGTAAASFADYRRRVTVRDARPTTVRGRPAMVGRHPAGGRMIFWLERPGTAAWIRVSDSLGGELVPIAASVKTPVGD